MKIVCDASPFIFLSKIGKLAILDRYNVCIPNQVYAEIKSGKLSEKEDYIKIDELITRGKIQVQRVARLKDVPFTIEAGENEAIALALELNADFILIDDKKGWKLAQLRKLRPKGTLALLIEEYKSGRMQLSEIKRCFEMLFRIGFRISEEKLLSLLNELERK